MQYRRCWRAVGEIKRYIFVKISKEMDNGGFYEEQN